MTRTLQWVGVGTGVDVDGWRTQLGPEIDRRFDTRSVAGAEFSWQPGMPQIPADAALDALIERYDQGRQTGAEWVLGITNLDLSAPNRPFVFGEATVGGCCALVSLARLNDGPEQLATRLFTTLVHELAHVAGLDHCDEPGCVMWPSSTVDDTDRKGNAFCASCTAAFARVHS